jgi:UDP-N-acetylmuramate dehydrogenase
MLVENHVSLQPYNTFGIVAKALHLARIRSTEDVHNLLNQSPWGQASKFVLGGGSNIVLTGDVKPLVLKVEIMGKRLVHETDKAWVVEAGAGESWHDLVAWTLAQGWPGLENLALIPGTVGGTPVQNIGAYGLELQDRFDSLDGIHLGSLQHFTLESAHCAFGYRDSVFKHPSSGYGLAGQALITHVRLSLPKRWRPELGYLDLQKKMQETGNSRPSASTVFEWVCQIRRAKLPDPKVLGNAGSFFKNPTVSAEQCADIIARDPRLVYYELPNGAIKLAAGWLVDACGWKGKSIGQAAVYEKQALVLVNRGAGPEQGLGATGGEVMTLARAIQTSVYERFGILLEPEPVVI